MAQEKFVNVNELQNETPKILKDLKNQDCVVLRYSDPVGVLVSYDKYKKLMSLESEFVSECKACLKEVKGK